MPWPVSVIHDRNAGRSVCGMPTGQTRFLFVRYRSVASIPAPAKSIDAFIARWTAREGGAERANYPMFLTELCALVGVDRPDPAGADTELNDYVFERAVKAKMRRATFGGRIDLYKRGAFVLEAKQSRQKGGEKE